MSAITLIFDLKADEAYLLNLDATRTDFDVEAARKEAEKEHVDMLAGLEKQAKMASSLKALGVSAPKALPTIEEIIAKKRKERVTKAYPNTGEKGMTMATDLPPDLATDPQILDAIHDVLKFAIATQAIRLRTPKQEAGETKPMWHVDYHEHTYDEDSKQWKSKWINNVTVDQTHDPASKVWRAENLVAVVLENNTDAILELARAYDDVRVGLEKLIHALRVIEVNKLKASGVKLKSSANVDDVELSERLEDFAARLGEITSAPAVHEAVSPSMLFSPTSPRTATGAATGNAFDDFEAYEPGANASVANQFEYDEGSVPNWPGSVQVEAAETHAEVSNLSATHIEINPNITIFLPTEESPHTELGMRFPNGDNIGFDIDTVKYVASDREEYELLASNPEFVELLSAMSADDIVGITYHSLANPEFKRELVKEVVDDRSNVWYQHMQRVISGNTFKYEDSIEAKDQYFSVELDGQSYQIASIAGDQSQIEIVTSNGNVMHSVNADEEDRIWLDVVGTELKKGLGMSM